MLNLKQAITAYLNAQTRRLADSTVTIYRQSLQHLLTYFGDDAELESLNRAQLKTWRDGLFAAGLAVNTIRRIHGDAATFFNWCVQIGLLDASPMAGLSKPAAPEKGPRAISVADFKLMLHEAAIYRGNHYEDAQATTARNVALLLFLASSGCRVGGLVSARISKLIVDDAGAQCEVLEKGRGGGVVRTVYLSETATIAVLEWLDHRPAADHDYIFTVLQGNTHGRPMKTNQVRKTLGRIAKRAGVSGRWHPHAFRHAAAREWLRRGADLKTVSQLLGHKDIKITADTYALWDTQELRASHNRVDWTDE